MSQLRLLLAGIALLCPACLTQDRPFLNLALAAKRGWARDSIQEVPVNPVQGSAYINQSAYALLDPSLARMEINLNLQKATLFHGDIPVIETPISSGIARFPTKEGDFAILEKKQYKESNLYGRWVDASTGRTVVSDGDARIPGPPGTVFKGTPVPLWQRVTHDGIGMHVGTLPGYAASHGCIRFPGSVMPLIYEKTTVGTPVTIYSTRPASSARAAKDSAARPVTPSGSSSSRRSMETTSLPAMERPTGA